MCLPVHLQHLRIQLAHCTSTEEKEEKKKKRRKKNLTKAFLQDNSTAEETSAQWSPDIIHSIDSRPLSTEGGAHLKVTGLGDRGIVHTTLPPRQQSP